MEDISIQNAIEIIANVLYLIEHCADDPQRVRELTRLASPHSDQLQKYAATLTAKQPKSQSGESRNS